VVVALVVVAVRRRRPKREMEGNGRRSEMMRIVSG
jgi:hypothetical protein